MALAIGTVRGRRHRRRRERRAHHERGTPPPRDATRKAMDQHLRRGDRHQISGALRGVRAHGVSLRYAVGAIYRQFAVTLVLTMLFSALDGADPHARHVCHRAEVSRRWSHDSAERLFDSRASSRALRTRYRKSASNASCAVRAARLSSAGGDRRRRPVDGPPVGSFLPEEDQGYFIALVQLPPGPPANGPPRCCRAWSSTT